MIKEEKVTPSLAGFVARYELIIILAVSPLFLFPTRASIVGLVIVAGVWIARRMVYGRLTRTSSMNMPEVMLVLMALVGYFISVDRELSGPKLWGILFQTILFFSVLNGLNNLRSLHLMGWGIVLLTIGVALLSLFGTDWDIVRLAQLPQLYERLPRLIRNIPDSGLSPGQDLFHPREVGATMGMLLPFVSALILSGYSRILRLFAFISLFVGGVVLLLSQALMGILGLLIGWAILAIWWRRWMVVPILVSGFALAIFVLLSVPDNWQAILLSIDNPIGLGVVLRLDMWSRAMAMIADMPYTGIGLNTYPLIQTHFYIGHTLGPEPHAHNLLLQTAIDLGVPGLVAFLWLLAAFYLAAWQTSHRLKDKYTQALVIGSVAATTSYIAGGLLDTITLGAKPIAALSLFLGLVGAINWLSQEEYSITGDAGVNLRATLRGLVVPGFLILALVLSIALWPGRLYTNLALIPAHQSIYTVRQTGELPFQQMVQAAEWLPRAISQDEDNPELHGAYASLLAWQNGPAAALDSFSRRIELDGREPFAYAPFLAWQDDLAGALPKSEWETLIRIYRPWQARFPNRAENYSLLSIVYERYLDDITQAFAVQRQALDTAVAPRSLSEFHHSLLAEKLLTSAPEP